MRDELDLTESLSWEVGVGTGASTNKTGGSAAEEEEEALLSGFCGIEIALHEGEGTAAAAAGGYRFACGVRFQDVHIAFGFVWFLHAPGSAD